MSLLTKSIHPGFALIPIFLAIIGGGIWYSKIQREIRLENELRETERKAAESLIPAQRALEDAKIQLLLARGIKPTPEALQALDAEMKSEKDAVEHAKKKATPGN